MFVIDASVALAWCFDGEATPYSSSVLDRLRHIPAVAPGVWPLEIANAVLMGERRQRLTEGQATRALLLLERLPITVDVASIDVAWGATLALARAQALTVYDASYLDLAIRRRLPLATQDARLRDAAARVGVDLIQATDD